MGISYKKEFVTLRNIESVALTDKEMVTLAINSVLENMDDNEIHLKREDNLIKIKVFNKNNKNSISIEVSDEVASTKEMADGVAPTNKEVTSEEPQSHTEEIKPVISTAAKNILTPANRRKAILEELDKNPKIMQNQLAKLFMVSQKTISNDLVILNNNKKQIKDDRWYMN